MTGSTDFPHFNHWSTEVTTVIYSITHELMSMGFFSVAFLDLDRPFDFPDFFLPPFKGCTFYLFILVPHYYLVNRRRQFAQFQAWLISIPRLKMIKKFRRGCSQYLNFKTKYIVQGYVQRFGAQELKSTTQSLAGFLGDRPLFFFWELFSAMI